MWGWGLGEGGGGGEKAETGPAEPAFTGSLREQTPTRPDGPLTD